MSRNEWGLNRNTWARDRFVCRYCGFDGTVSLLAAHQLTVDHVRPRAKGGTDDLENLVTACCACNGIKAEWDKRYDPASFADKTTAEIFEAARKYLRDWYKLWDPGYQRMLDEALEADPV